MNFKKEINNLEDYYSDEDYIIIKGKYPILITAPHTIQYLNDDGTIKLSEPFTKAIALYLAKKLNIFCVVKNRDSSVNPNKDYEESMKDIIVSIINDNKIGLSLDLHGAARRNNFDIELGTVNNISADFSTINELKEAFLENGISNVCINNPFKGGAITRTIIGMTDAEAIQIEINREYRMIEDIDRLEQVCKSFENFIRQYIEIIINN